MFISLSVDQTKLWEELVWVVKINQRKLCFKCPLLFPLSVDTSIYCLCECLGSIYIMSICLLYWLEGRKSSNFLKSWLICSCGHGFQKSVSWLHFGNYLGIYANIFDTITHDLSVITCSSSSLTGSSPSVWELGFAYLDSDKLSFASVIWDLALSSLVSPLGFTHPHLQPGPKEAVGVADQDSGWVGLDPWTRAAETPAIKEMVMTGCKHEKSCLIYLLVRSDDESLLIIECKRCRQA